MGSIEVKVALKDVEPIAELLNSFVEVLLEIEIKDYTDSDGINLRESNAYKNAAQIIRSCKEGIGNETSCR